MVKEGNDEIVLLGWLLQSCAIVFHVGATIICLSSGSLSFTVFL